MESVLIQQILFATNFFKKLLIIFSNIFGLRENHLFVKSIFETWMRLQP